MSKKDSYSFFKEIQSAKKILVLDLGFLGDSIHLIPSLNCIRKSIPKAELHVMIADHVKDLLTLTPWVDKVWGYPRFPKGPKWYQDFGRISALRTEKFDAVINLNGSDRSSILTVSSGSKKRLGRVPEKMNPMWKSCFTHIVNVAYGHSGVFQQRYDCLQESGFPDVGIHFNLVVPENLLTINPIQLLRENYIHVSPFTPVNDREIPYKQLAGLLHELSDKYPQYKILLTCSPNERETGKLKKLTRAFHFDNWETFPDKLSITQLGAIIQKSVIHLGGDTGSLHLANALGKKTVSWFHENKLNQMHWMPKGKNHRSVIGSLSNLGLVGISNSEILERVEELINEIHSVAN